MITLKNLEYLQDLVGVSNNGYNIGYIQVEVFFLRLFRYEELIVELIHIK